MTTANVALRAAIHDALLTDSALTSALGGGRVYDEPPRDAEFPYVTLGEARLIDASSDGGQTQEHQLTLHAWSRKGGHREAHVIAGALLQALDDAPLSPDGHRLVNLRFSIADIRRESDGAPITRWFGFAPSLNHLLKGDTMAAQKGKDLLLKMHDGTSFATVAGLRSRRIAFNAETVDVTHAESTERRRELLAGAGVKRASVSGRGLFKDSASDAMVRQAFFDGVLKSCQVVVPDFGVIEGLFQISSLEFSGEHNGEVTFDLSLESAGALTFTAA